MSFDLAVWSESTAVSAAEAIRKHHEFAAREPDAGPADPRAVVFHRELTAHYPSLSDLPVEELENSPWNGDPMVVGEAVLMTMSWSAADAAVLFIQELAERHEMVLFDPQGDTVYLPPTLRGEPALRLSACDGARIEDPDAAAIEAAVAGLSPGNWFLVLDRGDHYVQVGLGEQAAARPGRYVLEHRQGQRDRHFRAEVAERAVVSRAFTGFAAGEDSWREGFDWQRVEY